MIARLATGLHKLPSEIRTMSLPQAFEMIAYWDEFPPEHESIAIALQVYTTWKPGPSKPAQQDQQKSLELRWNAGALNAKQLFDLTGGKPVQMN